MRAGAIPREIRGIPDEKEINDGIPGVAGHNGEFTDRGIAGREFR